MTDGRARPGAASTLCDELYEILLLGALDEPQQRLTATRYTLCREVLLRSPLRPPLPGFMQQCLTFDRFRDFIHLYHPSLNARVEMIDDALRASLGKARDGRTKECRRTVPTGTAP